MTRRMTNRTTLAVSLSATGLALAAGLQASDAHAAAVIYEPFSYTAGDLSDNASPATGTGLSGNWSDNGTTVTSPGLDWGTLATTGNKTNLNNNWAAVSTGTTLDGLLDNGDTLWFSVLVKAGQVGSNPDFGFALGTETMSSGN